MQYFNHFLTSSLLFIHPIYSSYLFILIVDPYSFNYDPHFIIVVYRNSTLWMSQAAMILQKTPQYQSEATKVIEKYDMTQSHLQTLKNGDFSKFSFLFPAVSKLPAFTFGWPIVKYAIRQQQMDQLMSQYYKNGELFNSMVAKNRKTFTL